MDERALSSDREGENIQEMEELAAANPAAEGKSSEGWPESWSEEAAPGNEQEETFSLRHLGQTRELGLDETLSLAQKGLDYDRIRRERDSMKPRLKELEALLSRFSAESGLSTQEILRMSKAEELMRRAEEGGGSLTYEEAMSMAQSSDYDPEKAEKLRCQESILSFSEAFP